ncbi:hypothetical protein JHK85_027968 [Glycine max]|nr:hypothetical protein JHK85_027968 [Glycine max]
MDSTIRSRTPPNFRASLIQRISFIVDNAISNSTGTTSNFGTFPVHGFASVVGSVIRSGTASTFKTFLVHGFSLAMDNTIRSNRTASNFEASLAHGVSNVTGHVGGRLFTPAELKAAIDNFSRHNKIGAGSFGVVYRVNLVDDREPLGQQEYLILGRRPRHRDPVGSIGYIDPEHCDGLNVLTAKNDVYGFGVVIIELLTVKRAILKDAKDGITPLLSVVDLAVPAILALDLVKILDPKVSPPDPDEALAVELVAYSAVHCVSLEGKNIPTMADIVLNLERALAICNNSI